MRIGVFYRSVEITTLDTLVEWAGELERDGFAAAWLPQSNGYDALTALAVIGRQVGRIELGTAVIPIYPRHPFAMATQAMTTQEATNGRLTLGIGLSDPNHMAATLGVSVEKPARDMREYLAALLPLAREGEVSFAGETITAHVSIGIPNRTRFPVLLAALAPRMLQLAGAVADGTITWMTGPKTVESHIVPSITAAAEAAGRTAPRVVVALPICVGDDDSALRLAAAEAFAGYERPSSYKAMLDREGVGGPGDVAVIGSEASVRAQLDHFEAVGATDFVAILFGSDTDRARTREFLMTLAAAGR